MKGLIRFFSILCLVISANLSANVHQFKFNYQDRLQGFSDFRPIVQEHGTVTVNGVRMKGYNTIFNDPRNINMQTYYAKNVQAKIRAEHLKFFESYAMPNGVVFAPKGWKLAYGEITQNGSITYLFVPPNGDDGYMLFQHFSNCVSCAMENGSLFFKEAEKDAKDHDFKTFSSNLPLKVVKIKQNLASYYGEQGYHRIDGISFYDTKAKLPFWKAEISLPPLQRHLANPLLNQFITKYS